MPSASPPPSPPQPTAVPVDGVTSTQVNVRAEPSTASSVLGIIPPATRIEITGRDPGGNWWQINYPQGVEGKGWVTAQYITTASIPEVPTIGDTAVEPNSGNVAIVQQQLNVRSGPGTDFNSLGTLNPQDVVSLIGKDPNGAWLQIEFPTGPEGKGWVSAAFVQVQGAENVPIVSESGLVVGTGTPTVIPPTPSPTLVPAREDGDSPDSPIASVAFEPNGTQSFMYNGDVSAPQGDVEDWITFRPYGELVFLSLECKGSDSAEVEILENNSPVNTYMKCGARTERLAVKAGGDYVLRLKAVPSAAALEYINYILTVRTRP
ncbi:MAG TPA: SH3 domain-containing protein [Anaerolineales bacterium]